jgi:hydrogenase expression/formation protein HypC
MCLAVPMEIVEISEDGSGVAALEGSRARVNLSLIENPACGDYVIVHAGFAIEKLDREEADERIRLFAELGDSQPRHDPPGGRADAAG